LAGGNSGGGRLAPAWPARGGTGTSPPSIISAGLLFGVARAGSDLFVLVLANEGANGWKVVGLAR
jgi:hypothetical protein